MQPCSTSPCTASLFLWTSVNFLEKRSSFICHVQYWKREWEDLKRWLPSSFLTVTEIMNSSKADSWQEMQSRGSYNYCVSLGLTTRMQNRVCKAQEEPCDETCLLVWNMSTEVLFCSQKLQRRKKQGRNRKPHKENPDGERKFPIDISSGFLQLPSGLKRRFNSIISQVRHIL